MQSLAWSTVAILILLLPGFFFSLGLYAPERFARDIAPRNPLATLAAAVLVAFVSHAILSWASGALYRTVDWAAVLEAIQLPPPGTDPSNTATFRAAAH